MRTVLSTGVPWTPQHLLDAFPDAAALLDDHGVVRATNDAWDAFSSDDRGVPTSAGIGTSYLEVCRRAAAAGSADAAATVRALERALSGEGVEQDFEYKRADESSRWFTLRVSRIVGPPAGVMVTHHDITRHKHAEQVLARQIWQDPLTGLSNRTALMRSLARALVHTSPAGERRSGAGVGVLYLDVDGLKPINDSFGHAAGDELLQVIATRLATSVREGDTVARLGGDEFVVVAPRIGWDELREIKERIINALAEPTSIHDQVVPLTASIGLDLAARGELPAAVLARADAAMYVEKWRRRGSAAGA